MNINKISIIVAMYFAVTSQLFSQDLEPRAYSNAPVGLNFITVGLIHTEGALVFDPGIPIVDADSSINIGVFGYVRTLDVAGMSAKMGITVPYANLSASGFVSIGEGERRVRDITGVADPSFFFNINFYGAPALNLNEFRAYQQDTIIGFKLKVTAPLGSYDNTKLINLGTNRWSIKPEFGISKALNNWTIESMLAATYYTENNEFNVDQTRHQKPVYSLQAHVTYTLRNKIWLSYGFTYFTGGETEVDGVKSGDLQNNTRSGFTVAVPVNKYQSIKILVSTGVSTRTGSDYDSIGIFWQTRWGVGL